MGKKTVLALLLFFYSLFVGGALSMTYRNGDAVCFVEVVGWSQQGAVAYYYTSRPSASGMTDAGFVIADMIGDAVLFIIEERSGDERLLTELKAGRRQIIAGALSRFGIRPGGGEEQGLQFSESNARYRIALAAGEPGRWRLLLYKENVSKFISEASPGTGGRTPVLFTAVRSPFEPRIAVISIKQMRGHSGENLSPLFTGAHLLAGF